MTALAFPTEQLDALDRAIARGREVVDPDLATLAEACIVATLGHGPRPQPADALEADVLAVLEQGLMDVARLDDDTVRRADRHFAPGGLADLVTLSYALEARTRLQIAAGQLGAQATYSPSSGSAS